MKRTPFRGLLAALFIACPSILITTGASAQQTCQLSVSFGRDDLTPPCSGASDVDCAGYCQLSGTWTNTTPRAIKIYNKYKSDCEMTRQYYAAKCQSELQSAPATGSYSAKGDDEESDSVQNGSAPAAGAPCALNTRWVPGDCAPGTLCLGSCHGYGTWVKGQQQSVNLGQFTESSCASQKAMYINICKSKLSAARNILAH